MDRWLLSFFIGAILSLFLPIVPAIFYVILFTGIALCLLLNRNTRILASFFLGISVVIAHASFYESAWERHFDSPSKPEDVILSGVVTKVSNSHIDITGGTQNAGLSKQKNESIKMTQRFVISVESMGSLPVKQAFNVKLSWPKTSEVMHVGQRWQLAARIKPANGLANQGGFSYQIWLRTNLIHATGYVKHSAKNLFLNENKPFRQWWIERFLAILPTTQESALVLALAFGERQSMSPEQWSVLQQTGTLHLLAISGMHLSLVAIGAFLLCLALFSVCSSVFSYLRSDLLYSRNAMVPITLFVVFCVGVYGYMANFSLPTVRALIMIGIFIVARMLSIRLNIVRIILLTLVLVIILMPQSVYSVSFWLSFYAVVTIGAMVWWCGRSNEISVQKMWYFRVFTWLKQMILLQTLLSVLMMPIVIFVAQSLPLSVIIANLIAIPIVSFVSLPLVLFSAISVFISQELAQFLLQCALWSLEILWQLLVGVKSVIGGSIAVSSTLWFVLSVSGIVFLVSFHSLRYAKCLRCAGIEKKYVGISVLALVFAAATFQSKGHQQATSPWQVYTLDVGQGLAVVIIKNNKAVLYDTGASYPGGFNMVDGAILPFLSYHGISELDYLFISHMDNDHAGGLDKLLALKLPHKLVANVTRDYSRLACVKGQTLLWQGLTLEVLWPSEALAEGNDDSCVIKVSDNQHSVLLTGDISQKVERKLVSEHLEDNKLDSDVLLAAHHGSNSSSIDSFIQAVSPDAVIFSAGFLNRWRHPRAEVVKRYKDMGVERFNTAANGMLLVDFRHDSYHVYRYRQDLWPFWFAN